MSERLPTSSPLAEAPLATVRVPLLHLDLVERDGELGTSFEDGRLQSAARVLLACPVVAQFDACERRARLSHPREELLGGEVLWRKPALSRRIRLSDTHLPDEP
jgi:hypothetical protein